MFIVLEHKDNTELNKRILIPKYLGYNSNAWIEIYVDLIKKTLVAKKVKDFVLNQDEWIEVKKYGFPSAILEILARR